VYLHPGQLCVARQPSRVTTVLGSCVAAVLYSPRLQMGGICHAVMPQAGYTQASGSEFRYTDRAVSHLFACFQRLGVDPGEIIVKLFGGANSWRVRAPAGSPLQGVGEVNVAVAQQVIAGSGAGLCAQDVGGHWGRKLHFFSHTGEVFVKRLGQPRRAATDRLAGEP